MRKSRLTDMLQYLKQPLDTSNFPRLSNQGRFTPS